MMTPRLLIPLLVVLAAGCVPSRTTKNTRNLEEAERKFMMGEFVRAATLYRLHLEWYPNEPRRAEILVRLGRCEMGAGNPEAALQAFAKAAGSMPDTQVRWEISFRRGIAYRMKGDYGRALTCFDEAEKGPTSLRDGAGVTRDELNYEIAIALFHAGRWEEGQKRLRDVSPRGPYADKVPSRLELDAFTVQVGTFTDEANAKRHAAKFKATVRPLPTDKPMFLVTVGSFRRYEDAKREAERLKRQGCDGAFVLP